MPGQDCEDARCAASNLDDEKCDNCVRVAEANHRIANNLALLAAYARLKTRSVADKGAGQTAAQAVLQGVAAQIGAVAQIHRMLISGPDGEADISMLLRAACAPLFDAVSSDTDCVMALAEGCVVKPKLALPVTQIVLEAVTNALKHGSSAKPRLIVTVESALCADGVLISVRDNGGGFPSDLEAIQQSTGMKVMRELAVQIGADLAFMSNDGACVSLRLPRGSRI